MADEHQLLGDAGVNSYIIHKEVKYPLSFKTQRTAAKFVEWAKSQAIDKVMEFKDKLPEARINSELDKLFARFDSPDPEVNFSFNGRYCTDLQAMTEGRMQFIRILLGAKAEALSQEDFEDLLLENDAKITAFMQSQEAVLTGIKAEFDWDMENDPEGAKVKNPKKLIAALRAAGLV